jgi:hypothetical protein
MKTLLNIGEKDLGEASDDYVQFLVNKYCANY